MKKLLCALAGIALAAGCVSTGSVSGGRSSALGRPVQAILLGAAGQRAAFFDKDGHPVPEQPPGQPGSVSIYNKDQTGQDNYAFDENGLVTRHQRSAGAHYDRGVWEELR